MSRDKANSGAWNEKANILRFVIIFIRRWNINFNSDLFSAKKSWSDRERSCLVRLLITKILAYKVS